MSLENYVSKFVALYDNSKKIVLEVWSAHKYGSQYLDKEKTNFFPCVQRVAARSIGMDLVAVQPMAGPVGNLMYLDYQYTPKEQKENTVLRTCPTPEYVGTMT